ncbi:hypothetical protein CLI64_08340 [Nostoc sp. CENA543]|nr:hypothetical protein CLI64_08340 [Nostoc sp. CENA543]
MTGNNSFTHHSPLTTQYSILNTHYSLLNTHYSLLITQHRLNAALPLTALNTQHFLKISRLLQYIYSAFCSV